MFIISTGYNAGELCSEIASDRVLTIERYTHICLQTICTRT